MKAIEPGDVVRVGRGATLWRVLSLWGPDEGFAQLERVDRADVHTSVDRSRLVLVEAAA